MSLLTPYAWGGRSRAALILVVSLGVHLAPAQMQPHSRHEGRLGPVVGCDADRLFILLDGRRREASYREFENRQGDAFAAGRVTISNVQADLDAARNLTPKELSSPGAIRFTYSAEITSDRPLANVYALLVFGTNGSIGTNFVKVGRLEAGRPRKVEVELRTRVDTVGHLHVFSETLEVQSNEVTGPYVVSEYYDSIKARFRGVPAMELCKSERLFPHVLSRDGRLLATTRDRETHRSLIVYDLESMRLLCDVAVGKHDDAVWDLTWVSPGEVAFISDDKLMMLDVAKGTYATLKEDVDEIFAAPEDQPDVLVLLRSEWGRGTWTARFNVRTRKVVDFEELDIGWSIFDRQGNARVRYVTGDRIHRYFYRPAPGAGWKPLDEAVKQDGLKFNLRPHELLERKADIHSLGPDGDTLYLSTRIDSDLFQLAAFSMSQGRITRTIAKHPRYDLNAGDDGYSRLLFRKGTGELIGIVFETQKLEVVWWDKAFAAAQQAIDHQFPDNINVPLDWSDNAETIIYRSTSDRDPGTVHVFRPGASALIPVFVGSEYIKGRTLAATQPISFQARDGARIPGYVTWPPDMRDQPAPLVVNIHGGPTSRDSWRFDAMNQFLATRGYVVLQVNYRGSSGFGAAFQLAGLRSRLDTVILDDIADGVRHLIATGKVDPARVGVMGSSFGGWATYMSLIKYPDLYRAGVAAAAVSHWRAALRDERWRFGRKRAYLYWKSVLDHEDFGEAEKYIDPLMRNTELHQPIFIMHGELDPIVHPSEARLMVDALRKHNANVQALSFPYGGHGNRTLVDRVTELNEVGSFFDRHLAPRPAPDDKPSS